MIDYPMEREVERLRNALWLIAAGEDWAADVARTALLGEDVTQPNECSHYIFNGCPHPQFCKEGCMHISVDNTPNATPPTENTKVPE